MTLDRLYTISEAAKILGVSYERVRQMLRRDELRGKHLGQRRQDGAYAGRCWEITEAGLAVLKARPDRRRKL